MILEGLVTTINADGTPNLSPMGPVVDEGMERFVLRPFQTSTTYENLRRTGQGVLHVTDDVELLARAAVGRLEQLPPMRPAAAVQGFVLADTCRWYAFNVEHVDASQPRATMACRVVETGRQRDFFGFNRAKHAVVEAAILATRLELLPAEQIAADYDRLRPLVEKTGGDQERRAFEFLENYVQEAIGERKNSGR